ncbi:MAG TPA: hypothetical protein VIJ42_13740 [Stellaceae bacterium]
MISAAATLLQLGLLVLLTVGPAHAACGPDLDKAYIYCLRQQQCMGGCPHDSDCPSIKKEALQCYAARDKARKAENEKETQEYLVKVAQNPGWPCLGPMTCYPQFIPKACYGFIPGARPPYTEQMLNDKQPRCQNQIAELLDAMRKVNALPKLTPQEAERELHMMPDSPTLMTRKKLVDIEARISGEKAPPPNPNQQRREYQRQEIDLFMANCGPHASAELRPICPGVKRLLARKAKAGDPVARCLVSGHSNCANAR